MKNVSRHPKTIIRIVIASLFLFLGISQTASAYGTYPTSVKNPANFHPGYYMMIGENDNYSYTYSSFKDNVNFVGVKKNYAWSKLEPSLGVYDFSQIDADLNYLKSTGKRLWLQIGDTQFGPYPPLTPSYMWKDSSYGCDPLYYGNYARTVQDGGWLPCIWNTKVQGRITALYNALGARYNSNPYIEAVTLGETSTGSTGWGYSTDVEQAAFKVRALAGKKAFPDKVVVHSVNYGVGLYDLAPFVLWLTDNGIGINNPDMFLTPAKSYLLNTIYPMSLTYHNSVPIAVDVAWSNYVEENSLLAPPRPNTSEELLNGAIQKTNPHYVLWEKRDPYFYNDAIPAIQKVGPLPAAKQFYAGTGNNPLPTVTLSATPTSVTSGTTATLTWSSTNSTSCTASNGWTGAKATAGTQVTSALTTATTYTLTCTGAGGTTAPQSVTIMVTPPLAYGTYPASVKNPANFHPGYYLLTSSHGSALAGNLSRIANQPLFKGAEVIYWWDDLVPGPKGQYNFVAMDANLAYLKSIGKQMSIQIVFTQFGPYQPKIPAYMFNDTTYGGDATYHGAFPRTGNGWYPVVWNSKVQAEFISLIQAIGARYAGDPNVEGITLIETAMETGSAYGGNGTLIETAYKAFATAARNAFPGKTVNYQVNFTPFSDRAGFIDWLVQNNIGLGTPDVIYSTPPSTNPLSYNNEVLPKYTQYHNQIPTGPQIQFPDWASNGSPLSGDASISESMLKYAVQTMNPWYLYWDFDNGTYNATILPAITAYGQLPAAKQFYAGTVVPPPTSGYTAQYWNTPLATSSPTFPTTVPTLTRTDADINFFWGTSTPASTITADHFAARWTKTQNFTAGTYRFTVTADDGIRVYVDNNILINQWKDQGAVKPQPLRGQAPMPPPAPQETAGREQRQSLAHSPPPLSPLQPPTHSPVRERAAPPHRSRWWWLLMATRAVMGTAHKRFSMICD